MSGVPRLVCSLLSGTGMRLTECLALRVRDIDFEVETITVRDGKGAKDRITLLPQRCRPLLQRHLERRRLLATHLLDAGTDIRTAAPPPRHLYSAVARIRTTRRYHPPAGLFNDSFDGHEGRARVRMNPWRHSVVLAGTLLPVCGHGQTTPRPPAVFVDRDVCPGECCTYGEWRAERRTTLYASPSVEAKVVGQLEAGGSVDALTGEVHTKAGKFVVRKESAPYRAGEVIWVYTYLGEGSYRVWRAGKMVEEEISVEPEHQRPDDWGYYQRAPVSTWWIHLRRPDGLEGWTRDPKHFSGTHSCG